ncbi:MAG: hypothetical protein ACLFPF_05875 [Halanaerobiales bacterium]
MSNSKGTVTSNTIKLTVINSPPGISRFNSIAEYFTSYVYWENPVEEESWDKVIIIRNNDSEITTHTDGEIIYEGSSNSFIDKDLSQGTSIIMRLIHLKRVGQ